MSAWLFPLRRGNSPDPKQGACLMDAVSWVEYGTLGDHPPCVCPTLISFGILLNDFLPEAERQRMRDFIPLLSGTNQGDRLTEVRRQFLMGKLLEVADTVGIRYHHGNNANKLLQRCRDHGRYTSVGWSIYAPLIDAYRRAVWIGRDSAEPAPAERIAEANRRFMLARAA